MDVVIESYSLLYTTPGEVLTIHRFESLGREIREDFVFCSCKNFGENIRKLLLILSSQWVLEF